MRWKAESRSALIKHQTMTILSFKTSCLFTQSQGWFKFCSVWCCIINPPRYPGAVPGFTVFLWIIWGRLSALWEVLLVKKKKRKAHRLSLRAWQLSHTLTGWSQPRDGTGLMFVEQGPHTPCPQALQWCLDIAGVKVLEHWWHWVMSWSGTQ